MNISNLLHIFTVTPYFSSRQIEQPPFRQKNEE